MPNAFKTFYKRKLSITSLSRTLKQIWFCISSFARKFPKLNKANIKEGVFVGQDIKKLTENSSFTYAFNYIEKQTWNVIINVMKNFLGNYKSADFSEKIEVMLDCYQEIGCNMSSKLHFLHSYLSSFYVNIGLISDVHGECFHQNVATIKELYQERCEATMLTDYLLLALYQRYP